MSGVTLGFVHCSGSRLPAEENAIGRALRARASLHPCGGKVATMRCRRKGRLSHRSEDRVMRDGRRRRRRCVQWWHRERADDRDGAHAGHGASPSHCPHFVPILTAFRAAESRIKRVGRPLIRSATTDLPPVSPAGCTGECTSAPAAKPGTRKTRLEAGSQLGRDGGGAGDRTRVRSRVPCDIYECSPGIDLTRAAPWDQARLRPASVYVPPGAEAPPGGEAACINVGSDFHSREAGRRQAEA